MASLPNCSTSISSLEGKQFDYIIVGGGTAGLVLASRLSEDPGAQVLVVEAGAERLNDPQILTPGLVGTLYSDPKYDWDYQSEPQPQLNNRIIPQPRGRVLGGTSALNFQLVLYPSKRDLDSWAHLGNKGWNWDDVASYYHKFSTVHPPSDETRNFLNLDYVDAEAPTQLGPVQISFGDEYPPPNKAWVETFANLGYRMSDDPIKGSGLGAFTHPASICPKTKTRSYSASAYYTSAVASRTNLQILTEASVDKVALDNTKEGSAVATGIKVTTSDGQQHEIPAKSEVIISAGTLHSPKILELSGIGGKELLGTHGIPVVIENPNVGENLQDHCIVCQSFEVNDGVITGDLLRNPEILGAIMAQYQANGGGPLGSSTIASSYMPLTDAAGPISPGVIQDLLDKNQNNYHEFPGRNEQYQLLRDTLQNPKESSSQHHLFPSQVDVEGSTTMVDLLRPDHPENYLTIMTMLNRPFSRGYCHIKSADPAQNVTYNPRFLTHPLDIEILSRHVQFVDKFVATEPMASIFKKDGKRIPAQPPTASSLEAAREIVRQASVSVFHISGTCAMMPREIGGVVNERLVVHGTKNLRVVDASIFPLEPLGNIQTTVYATAEKAADMIKEDRKRG